jgi:hypothetical protein
MNLLNDSVMKIDKKQVVLKITTECKKLMNIDFDNKTFPGPQPVAVEKKDFTTLNNNDYMICEKTDGERIVLIFIKINDKPMCFITNRNNEYFFVPLSLKKEVFEGSIFDGELIKNKNGIITYIIHDCMSFNGVSFLQKPHSLRYGAIMDFIVKRYIHKDSDPFQIKTKIFYKYSPELSKTWEHIQDTTENKIDGLIFTPIYQPIKFGRMNELFKWKEPDNNTMDFLVKKNKNITLSYLSKKQSMIIFRSFDPLNTNFKIIDDFLTTNNKESMIIEFKYSLNTKIFTPYRIRSDKTEPNGEVTIKNTMKNIEEAINIKDFIF